MRARGGHCLSSIVGTGNHRKSAPGALFFLRQGGSDRIAGVGRDLWMSSCSCGLLTLSLSDIPPDVELCTQHTSRCKRSQTLVCCRASAFTVVLATSCAALSYVPSSLLVMLVLRSGFVFTHHLSSGLLFVQTLSCVSLRKSPFSSLW